MYHRSVNDNRNRHRCCPLLVLCVVQYLELSTGNGDNHGVFKTECFCRPKRASHSNPSRTFCGIEPSLNEGMRLTILIFNNLLDDRNNNLLKILEFPNFDHLQVSIVPSSTSIPVRSDGTIRTRCARRSRTCFLPVRY